MQVIKVVAGTGRTKLPRSWAGPGAAGTRLAAMSLVLSSYGYGLTYLSPVPGQNLCDLLLSASGLLAVSREGEEEAVPGTVRASLRVVSGSGRALSSVLPRALARGGSEWKHARFTNVETESQSTLMLFDVIKLVRFKPSDSHVKLFNLRLMWSRMGHVTNMQF